MFEDEERAKQFYSRILNRAALNIWAVQRGVFDALLCDTDDETAQRRWSEQLPRVVQAAQAAAARGENMSIFRDNHGH